MRDQTADLLDRHGIPHGDPVDIYLTEIDLGLSIAHQVRGHPVDQGHVDRLTDGYARGDTFPPLIVRPVDGAIALVGGMHRTHAALAADVKSHAAYMVDVDDHTARLLAVDDNARHGLPLTRAEAIRQAVLLVEGGSTVAQAAGAVGVTRHHIDDELACRAATTRATQSGVGLAWAQIDRDSQGRPHRVALHAARVEDDTCFAALVQTLASNPKARHQKTVRALVDRLAKIPDQQDRLAEIGDLDDQGDQYHGGPGSNVYDDNATVTMTRLLIDLADLDVDQAITGLRGRDAVDRAEKRIKTAAAQVLALGRRLDRRKQTGR